MAQMTQTALRPRTASLNPLALLAAFAGWLVRLDQGYREIQTLKSLPDERLDDMGLTRKDVGSARLSAADVAFLRRPGAGNH